MAELDPIIGETLKQVEEITKEFLLELINKWNSMYIVTDSMKNHGMKVLVDHLKDGFQDMLLSEEDKKKQLMSEVREMLEECKNLEQALSFHPECDIDVDQPLSEVKKKLESALNKFEGVKKERFSKWNALKEREGGLCNTLGFKELTSKSTIPSEEDLERIEHYIFTMEEEKLRRVEECKKYREEIMCYINDLEISTVYGLEKTLIDGDIGELPLTEEGMRQLLELKESYEAEFAGAKSNAEHYIGILGKLWERLDTPKEYQIEFLENHKGVGRATLDKIRNEISRCEQLKKEMLVPLLQDVKEEIKDICDKLTYTEEQVDEIFNMYDQNHVSEDILDFYEMELERLKALYSEQCDILELVGKRNKMWNQLLHLEELAKDKNRLFSNRGGQLLKEEKERKAINQSFPKLNKQLVNLLEQYEENRGKPFLYYGENLLIKINLEWQDHLASKENKKLARKVEQKKLVETEAILGVQNAKRKAAGGPTTPTSKNNSKKLKLATGQSCESLISTTSCAPTTPTNKNRRFKLQMATAQSCESLISTSCQPKNGYVTRSASKTRHHDDSSISSYSVFQEQMGEKNWVATAMTRTPSSKNRKALKEVDANSPIVFHSSPVRDGTAAACVVNKTPKFGKTLAVPSAVKTFSSKTPTSVKRMVTPRRATPGNTPSANRTFNFTPAHSSRFRLNF